MILFGGVRFPIDRPSPGNISRLDHNVLPMIDSMHRNGIRVDISHMETLGRQLGENMVATEKEIEALVGKRHAVNPGSPPQVAELLFHKLRVQGDQPVRLTDTGAESTGADQLQLYEDCHPVVRLILDWRHYDKLKGTYADKMAKLARKDQEGRVHTRFKPTTTATGRLASENPNCFDAETEVLTPYGWMTFWEASLGKPTVMQYTDDGRLEFVRPTAWQQVTATRVVTIKSQQIDLRVTSDHRCLLQHGKNGSLQVFEAWQYPEDWKQLNAGKYFGPGLPLTVDEIRLLVAIQADGSIAHRSIVDFGFKKGRKLERLKEILDACGFEYRDGSNGDRLRIYAHCRPFALKWLGTGKRFGSWLLKMNSQQLDTFCEEVFHWDGCVTRMSHYASKIRSNAEWVQTMLALNGNRARLRRYVSQGGSESWQADVTRQNYTWTTNRNLKDEDLEEPETFYCCSVPSSYLLVRRGQNIMVTGQCQNIPTRARKGMSTNWGTEIRRGFTATPGWVLVSMDLSQIEMRWAAHYSQDPSMIDGYNTEGFDMHSRTAQDCGLCPPLGCDPNDPTHKTKHRLPAKTIGFGVLYLMGAQGLQLSIVDAGGDYWEESKCEALINRFYEARPAIRDWQELQFTRMRRYGMVWDLLGRHRLIPQAKSVLGWQAREGEREGANMPIQSAAQGSLKVAMAHLHHLLHDYNRGVPGGRGRTLLQVHDELIFEAKGEEVAHDWVGIAQPVMEGAVPLDVPVASSADIAFRWGDLK